MGRYVLDHIYGKEDDDFNPNQGYGFLMEKLRKQKESQNLKAIFMPGCDFTNKICTLGVEEDESVEGWFIRSKDPHDGPIVTSPNVAVAIFNADCPIVTIFDEDQGRLAVLHAGFRCLVPRQIKGKRGKSIIAATFQDKGFPTVSSRVFFGYGIGPCCFGVRYPQHYPEIDPSSYVDIPIGKATRGPRAGLPSIDLYKLAHSQLISLGVPPKNISADLNCISCFAIGEEHPYYSYCRDGDDTGRNVSLAWWKGDNPGVVTEI